MVLSLGQHAWMNKARASLTSFRLLTGVVLQSTQLQWFVSICEIIDKLYNAFYTPAAYAQ
ncbi:MAG: hypothetical protein OHK0046_06900 [Anaerolineae bacterium]